MTTAELQSVARRQEEALSAFRNSGILGLIQQDNGLSQLARQQQQWRQIFRGAEETRRMFGNSGILRLMQQANGLTQLARQQEQWRQIFRDSESLLAVQGLPRIREVIAPYQRLVQNHRRLPESFRPSVGAFQTSQALGRRMEEIYAPLRQLSADPAWSAAFRAATQAAENAIEEEAAGAPDETPAAAFIDRVRSLSRERKAYLVGAMLIAAEEVENLANHMSESGASPLTTWAALRLAVAFYVLAQILAALSED